MKCRLVIIPIISLAFMVAMPAGAVSYADGVAAYSLQDYERAYRIWLELAEAGDEQAQFRLAALYEFGFGIEQNSAAAAQWYLRAAESGDGRSQLAYAYLLLGGRGVEENKAEAAVWFRRAARKGLPKAQYELGVLYFLGEGVDQNLKSAQRWFEMANASFPDGARRKKTKEILGRIKAMLEEDQEP